MPTYLLIGYENSNPEITKPLWESQVPKKYFVDIEVEITDNNGFTQHLIGKDSNHLLQPNCKCCVRERMVSLTFCGSVVANTNTTCGGGSSSVFSSAASAAFDNMCTSSKINTR